MQNWRSRAGGVAHTQTLSYRAEGKRICFHIQTTINQGNVVVLCDGGIFQLHLQENRTKRFWFTSEALLISNSWVKNERKIVQTEAHLLCVPVVTGNLGFKHDNLKGDDQKSRSGKERQTESLCLIIFPHQSCL